MAKFEHIEYHVIQENGDHYVEFQAFGNDVKLPITWGEDARNLVKRYIDSMNGKSRKPRGDKGNPVDDKILDYLAEMAQKIVTYRIVKSFDIEAFKERCEEPGLSEDLKRDIDWLIQQLVPGEYKIPDAYLNVLNASARIGDQEIWMQIVGIIQPVVDSRRKTVSTIIKNIAAVYDKHNDKKIVIEPRSITVKAKPMSEWWDL